MSLPYPERHWANLAAKRARYVRSRKYRKLMMRRVVRVMDRKIHGIGEAMLPALLEMEEAFRCLVYAIRNKECGGEE